MENLKNLCEHENFTLSFLQSKNKLSEKAYELKIMQKKIV
jgi:hypothetical protein